MTKTKTYVNKEKNASLRQGNLYSWKHTDIGVSIREKNRSMRVIKDKNAEHKPFVKVIDKYKYKRLIVRREMKTNSQTLFKLMLSFYINKLLIINIQLFAKSYYLYSNLSYYHETANKKQYHSRTSLNK